MSYNDLDSSIETRKEKIEVFIDGYHSVIYWRRDGTIQKCINREQECTGSCPFLSLSEQRDRGSDSVRYQIHLSCNSRKIYNNNYDEVNFEVIKIDKEDQHED